MNMSLGDKRLRRETSVITCVTWEESKVTAAVQIDTNMVIKMSGEHTHDTDLTAKKNHEKREGYY